MSVSQLYSKRFHISSNLDYGSAYKGINHIDPTSPQDIATKAYVDNTAAGRDYKESVRTLATTNITLSGTQTISGVALSVGNRVGLVGQSAGAENGLWIVASGAWSRATDADASSEVTTGMYFFVEEGTYATSGWLLNTANPITLGTTALTFVQVSGGGTYTNGNGISLTGNVFSANLTARLAFTGTAIDLAAVTQSNTGGTAGINFVQSVSVDSYGRVTGQVTADVRDATISVKGIASFDTASFTVTAGAVVIKASGISNAQLANSSISFVNGGSIGISASPISLGGTLTITNNGVTSITGTTNQVNATAATGAITLSLPQSIHSGATPTFAGLTLTGGTVTVSTPLDTSTQTWNAGAVVFTAEVVNVTDTASAAGSKFVDYQIASVSKFVVRKDGTITTGIWGGTSIATTAGGTGLSAGPSADGQLLIGAAGGAWAIGTITPGTGVSIVNATNSITIGVSSAGMLKSSYVSEAPAGTVNGSNVTFTLTYPPFAGSETVFIGTAKQYITTDYTINNGTGVITFLSGSLPETGEAVWATYIKA